MNSTINEVEIVAKVVVYVADGLALVVALVDLLFFLLDLTYPEQRSELIDKSIMSGKPKTQNGT